MDIECCRKFFTINIVFVVCAVALADQKVDQELSNVKNQELINVDGPSEAGEWNTVNGINQPKGPIGGWDDDNDRAWKPDGNLHPDDDPKDWKIEDSIPGIPGQSYPNYLKVPDTTFDCRSHKDPGYYGDVEARCQVFHICQIDGRQNSFLCPVGTVFDQKTLVCDWWFNVNCAETPDHYIVNSNLYKEGGSIGSEWGARKGDTAGNWGNVAQPIPDGAVSWTMRDNRDRGSGAQNFPGSPNWSGHDTVNYNKGSRNLNTWGAQDGFRGNRLDAGLIERNRNFFDGLRNGGHVKGMSMRGSRSGRVHSRNPGKRRMRNTQNQKGGSLRWGESQWPTPNEKGGVRNTNFGSPHRNVKSGFGSMDALPHARNDENRFYSWDSSRNPLKGRNILDTRTGGKGSASQDHKTTKGSPGRRRQVSWTNAVNHGFENWNKGASGINPGLSNDGTRIQENFLNRRALQLQEQGHVSNTFPVGSEGGWNESPNKRIQSLPSAWNDEQGYEMKQGVKESLQWNNDHDRQGDQDYDYR